MGKNKKNSKCKLCSVKRKKWETNKFYGIECKLCGSHMIVKLEHNSNISKDEMQEIEKIIEDKYPGRKMLNTDCSKGDHWQIHLSKKLNK